MTHTVKIINENVKNKFEDINNIIKNFVEEKDISPLINILNGYNNKNELSELTEILLNYVIKENFTTHKFEKIISDSVKKIENINSLLTVRSVELLDYLFDISKTKLVHHYQQKNISDIIDKITSFEEITSIKKLIQDLKENNININQLDQEGLSLLHVAVSYRKKELVSFLLNEGANINLKITTLADDLSADNVEKSWTALDSLLYDLNHKKSEDRELFMYMISRGATLNLKILPNDLSTQIVEECRKNQAAIEEKIFCKIFEDITTKDQSDYNIAELTKLAKKNNFLVSFNDESILKNKISMYNEKYTKKTSIEPKLLCVEENINNVRSSSVPKNFFLARKESAREI